MFRLRVRHRTALMEPPSAQSPFAQWRHYPCWRMSVPSLRGRYSPVIALTDSFANPIWLLLPSAIGLVPEIFAGCYQPLLPTGSSRRYLCESYIAVFANAILPNNFGGQSESAFFANPIGTGPFVLKSFVKGGNAVLAKNKKYWQPGKPYLDEVNFSYISDDNQRVLQLKSGEVQVISAVPPAQVSALKADPALVLEAFGSWAVDLLFFNEKIPQFKDRHVRRAINHAINIEQLAKVTTFGTAEPGNSFFPPSLQYHAKVPTLGYSLAAAKAELAQSAYPHGFSTAILEIGGPSGRA